MRDHLDVDRPSWLIDAVHDPEIATVGAVQPLEVETKRSADLLWVLSQGAVDELDSGGSHLLRDPA